MVSMSHFLGAACHGTSQSAPSGCAASHPSLGGEGRSAWRDSSCSGGTGRPGAVQHGGRRTQALPSELGGAGRLQNSAWPALRPQEPDRGDSDGSSASLLTPAAPCVPATDFLPATFFSLNIEARPVYTKKASRSLTFGPFLGNLQPPVCTTHWVLTRIPLSLTGRWLCCEHCQTAHHWSRLTCVPGDCGTQSSFLPLPHPHWAPKREQTRRTTLSNTRSLAEQSSRASLLGPLCLLSSLRPISASPKVPLPSSSQPGKAGLGRGSQTRKGLIIVALMST